MTIKVEQSTTSKNEPTYPMLMAGEVDIYLITGADEGYFTGVNLMTGEYKSVWRRLVPYDGSITLSNVK